MIALVAAGWSAPRFCLWRADAALEMRDEEAALVWIERGEALWGDARRIALGRVTAHRRTGAFDLAGNALTEGRTAGVLMSRLEREQWLILAAAGRMDQVEGRLPELLAGTEPDPREVSDAFVTGFLQSARPGPALGLIEPWLADAPNQSQPWYLKGVALAFARNHEGAVAAFREAARLAPHREDVRIQWGESLLELQRSAEALPLFASVNSPRMAQLARFGEARAARRTGDAPRAQRLLEELVSAEPKNPAYWEELGRVRLDSGNSREGIAALERGFALAPNSVSLNEVLGRAQISAGERDAGMARLEQVAKSTARLEELRLLEDASEKAPRDADLRLRIARLYAEYETPEMARAWARSVLVLRPDDAEAKRLSETGRLMPSPSR
jgi:tetratricopeptide (TPR) repeat protein